MTVAMYDMIPGKNGKAARYRKDRTNFIGKDVVVSLFQNQTEKASEISLAIPRCNSEFNVRLWCTRNRSVRK